MENPSYYEEKSSEIESKSEDLENTEELKIIDVINACESALMLLDLLPEKLQNSKEQRAFIYGLTNLSEALTFFRDENPLLTEIQEKENKQILVFGFTTLRNKLIHQHPFLHLAGDDNLLLEASDYFKKNQAALKTALTKIKAKDAVQSNATCKKIFRKATFNIEKRELLEYIKATMVEISDLEGILVADGITIDSTLKGKALQTINTKINKDPILQAAVLNCLGNVNTFLQDAKRHHRAKYISLHSDYQENLSALAKDFLNKLNVKRVGIFHTVAESAPTGYLARDCKIVSELKQTYLTPISDDIEKETSGYTGFPSYFYAEEVTTEFSFPVTESAEQTGWPASPPVPEEISRESKRRKTEEQGKQEEQEVEAEKNPEDEESHSPTLTK